MPTGIYGSPELGQFREQRSSYPVQVDFIIPARNSRFYAVPLLGYLARYLLLIPHLIVLVLLTIAVALLQLVLWIPVLVGGKYPKWAYSFVGGYVRWYTAECILAWPDRRVSTFPVEELRQLSGTAHRRADRQDSRHRATWWPHAQR